VSGAVGSGSVTLTSSPPTLLYLSSSPFSVLAVFPVVSLQE
jgi:hypothetical protein